MSQFFGILEREIQKVLVNPIAEFIGLVDAAIQPDPLQVIENLGISFLPRPQLPETADVHSCSKLCYNGLGVLPRSFKPLPARHIGVVQQLS